MKYLLSSLIISLLIGLNTAKPSNIRYKYNPTKKKKVVVKPQITKPQVIKAIANEFADQGHFVVIQALTVANAESGLRPEAEHINKDGSKDHSVFQLNDCHWGKGNLKNWKENIKIAKKIWLSSSWCPWVVSKGLGFCR